MIRMPLSCVIFQKRLTTFPFGRITGTTFATLPPLSADLTIFGAGFLGGAFVVVSSELLSELSELSSLLSELSDVFFANGFLAGTATTAHINAKRITTLMFMVNFFNTA